MSGLGLTEGRGVRRSQLALFAVLFLLSLFTFSLGYLTGARTFTACEIKINQLTR